MGSDSAPSVYIGCDPSATGLCIAAIDELNRLIGYARFEHAKPNACCPSVCRYILHDHRLPSFLRWIGPGRVSIVAVEGQEIAYTSKMGANPRDLMRLANTTGALSLFFESYGVNTVVPLPAKWKGQVPKRINQARSWASLKIGFEATKHKDLRQAYCVPDAVHVSKFEFYNTDKIRKQDWRDIGDAAGLAIYAKETHERHRDQGHRIEAA